MKTKIKKIIHPRIIKTLDLTVGHRHCWCEAEVGGEIIKIRKPVGSFKHTVK